MGDVRKNGSHILENGSDLENWVTLVKKESDFEIWVTLEKMVPNLEKRLTLGNMGDSWTEGSHTWKNANIGKMITPQASQAHVWRKGKIIYLFFVPLLVVNLNIPGLI